MLVDTHCHLGDPRFDGDHATVLARALEAGVSHVIVVAESVPATDRAVELARRFALSATAGVHPHAAAFWDAAVQRRIEEALEDPAVVAVGETGLDYHYEHAPREVQRQVFEAHLALAAACRKPVVVHARDADADVAAMLDAWAPQLAAVVLHCFSAGAPLFEAGVALGAYVSFSGMVTFTNWGADEQVRACPADRLLVETDAPYLAPHPHRGRRNEPAYVTHVARRLAAVRGIPFDELALLTTANAVQCFGRRITQRLNPVP